MQLMDRIYCTDFLSMSDREQLELINKVRTTRISMLHAAQVKTKKITKSAMKNIAKNAGTKRSKKMMKDPTKAAKKALSNLTPEQIATIIANMPKD